MVAVVVVAMHDRLLGCLGGGCGCGYGGDGVYIGGGSSGVVGGGVVGVDF